MRLRTLMLTMILAILILLPGASWSTPMSGGPHLWLSTDPATFDEGGAGYVGDVGDAWLNDSYIVSDSPFDLYIFNASNGSKASAAENVQLLVTVHNGETGTVTVAGTTYSLFDGIDFGSYYGGGNHGVYEPHDGRFAIAALDLDLAPQASANVTISFTDFSEVHFDVFSDNGFWNPASHDVTASPVPEPATIVLLGSGLLGTGLFGRKKFRK